MRSASAATSANEPAKTIRSRNIVPPISKLKFQLHTGTPRHPDGRTREQTCKIDYVQMVRHIRRFSFHDDRSTIPPKQFHPASQIERERRPYPIPLKIHAAENLRAILREQETVAGVRSAQLRWQATSVRRTHGGPCPMSHLRADTRSAGVALVLSHRESRAVAYRGD